MVRTAGGLDEILTGRLTRRQFLKLSIAVAMTLSGCSSKSGSSRSSGSFAPAPSLSGHPKLVSSDQYGDVPDDIIPKIEKIGKPYIEVWAPVEKVLAFEVLRNGKDIVVYPWEVREDDIVIFNVCGPSTEDENTLSKEELLEIGEKVYLFAPTIGDDNARDKNLQKMKPLYYKPFGHDLARYIRFVDKEFGEIFGLIAIWGVVGNDVVANLTFVEKGCGKVASCVGTYNLKDPYNTAEFYNFKSWDKLNNMMIEILSHPTGYKPFKGVEKWFGLPHTYYIEGLKELERLRRLGIT